MQIPTVNTVNTVPDTDPDASGDGEDMDTADSEERRKRRHSSSDSNDSTIRQPGDGSLLTNTSIRQRMSTDLSPDISTPDVTSTPDRVAIQMNSIRGAASQALLPVIPSEGESVLSDMDHSTESNISRVTNVVAGIVEMTRTVAHSDVEHEGLSWDNQDLNNLQPLQMVSPRPVPNIPDQTPEPASDLAAPQANPQQASLDIATTLKEALKANLDEAMSRFEVTMINSIETINTKVNSLDVKVDSIELKTNAMEVKITDNQSRIEAIDTLAGDNAGSIFEVKNDIRILTAAKDRMACEVTAATGNIDRLDTGFQDMRANQERANGIIQTLLDKVAVLESQLASSTQSHSSQGQIGGLTHEEVKIVKSKIQRDDDQYYMSTLSFKHFAPPPQHIRDRVAAKLVLKMIGAEELMADVITVKFTPDRKSFRITFPTVGTCIEALSYLSSCCAQILRNGQTPACSFSQITPPRFNHSRQSLYAKAKELKASGQISRYLFILHKGSLALKVSKKGEQDKIISDEHSLQSVENMETEEADEDKRCLICIGDLDQGALVYLSCNHVFHADCIKNSMEKTIECPTCKQSPSNIAHLLKCGKCIQLQAEGDMDQPQLILSRKCAHLHTAECQAAHLLALPNQYPLTPDGIRALAQDDVHGCHLCAELTPSPNLEHFFMTNVPYYPNIRNYINPIDIPTIQPEPVPAAQPPAPLPPTAAQPAPIPAPAQPATIQAQENDQHARPPTPRPIIQPVVQQPMQPHRPILQQISPWTHRTSGRPSPQRSQRSPHPPPPRNQPLQLRHATGSNAIPLDPQRQRQRDQTERVVNRRL